MTNNVITPIILQPWPKTIGHVEHWPETIGHPYRVVDIFSANVCIYCSKH